MNVKSRTDGGPRRDRASGLLARFGAAMIVLATISSPADVLLKYEMTDLVPDYEDPVNRLDGDFLLIGSGVGTFFLPSTQSYPTSPVFSAGPASFLFDSTPLTNALEALAADCLIRFSFTVPEGVTNLALHELTLDVARGGGATNRGYGVYVTTPTATDEEVRASTYILTQRYVWDPQTIDLSGIASLQSLTSGQTVTIKIPFWASTNQTIEMDNIVLHGIANNTTNEPPPLPLVITHIEPHATSVELSWNSNTGRVYSVEYSLDLSQWAELATDIAAVEGGSTSIVLDTSGANAGNNITLLQYQMGVLTPQIQDAIATVAGGALTPGDGINLWAPNSGLGYPGAPVLSLNFRVAGPDLSTAILNTNLFTFTLTVGSGVTDLDLTRLTLNAARGGSSTPRGYGVLVTTPTTTDQEIQPPTDLSTQRPIWDPQSISLAEVTSLQNLTAGQVVTFTIPVYSPTAGGAVELDEITVKGNVTPGPPPPYVGANQLFLRVKEQ